MECSIKFCVASLSNAFPRKYKSGERLVDCSWNVAYLLIPFMLIGTLFTAIFKVIFPNEFFHHITTFNPFLILVIISFISIMLSAPGMIEILLGTILLQLGFGNGAIAAMVFTAPSFGFFILVLTKKHLNGYKVPLIMICITFIFGIGACLFVELLTKFF